MHLFKECPPPPQIYESVPPVKIILPGGDVMIRGRTQRTETGQLKVYFGHTFATPIEVHLQITPYANVQSGFIETPIKIEADHFISESLNNHPWAYSFFWLAIGR